MHRHLRGPAQLELFGHPEANEAIPTPDWQALPDQTRNRTIKLLIRLLMEHGNSLQQPNTPSNREMDDV